MSTDTAEPVVRRGRPKKELDTRAFTPDQKPNLVMPPLDEEVERESDVILSEKPLSKDYAEQLAMGEEPVTVVIHRSTEKFSPKVTDLIAINGIKAEMLFKNGWVPMGHLPRGQKIIVKRKYLEVMAGAKQDTVSTIVIEHDGEDPRNEVERITTATMSFQVIEDKNPKGAEWLQRLAQRGA